MHQTFIYICQIIKQICHFQNKLILEVDSDVNESWLFTKDYRCKNINKTLHLQVIFKNTGDNMLRQSTVVYHTSD